MNRVMIAGVSNRGAAPEPPFGKIVRYYRTHLARTRWRARAGLPLAADGLWVIGAIVASGGVPTSENKSIETLMSQKREKTGKVRTTPVMLPDPPVLATPAKPAKSQSPLRVVQPKRDHTTPSGLLAEVELQINQRNEREANKYLIKYVRSILIEIGLLPKNLRSMKRHVDAAASNVQLQLNSGDLKFFPAEDIKISMLSSIYHQIVYEDIIFGYSFGESERRFITIIDTSTFREFIDRIEGPRLQSRELYNTVSSRLRERLAKGISESSAAQFTRAIMEDFRAAGQVLDPKFENEAQLSAAVERVALAFLEANNIAALVFSKADLSARSLGTPGSWAERDKDRFPTAESFLRHHYGPRIGIEGDLTMAELQRLDSPLASALDLEFRGNGRRRELHRLLPTVKERNDAKLKSKHGYIPEGPDRKHKLTVMAREKQPRP